MPDAEDMCPNQAPGPVADPRRSGCPASDRDGDTIDDTSDKCLDQAETFNGVEDEDGCPDQGGKPLVVVGQKGTELTATFAQGVKFKGSLEAPEVEPASIPTLRALALEPQSQPELDRSGRCSPQKAGAVEEQAALAQAFAVVDVLRRFTYRDGVAETVGWKAVAKQPGVAASGFGVLVLAPRDDASKK